MENVILTVHLILALLLIGVVLLQRSEGGGLGMGSGGGGGAMSSRGVATALTKLTWIFATGFIITSISLTILAAKNSAGSSVIDQIGGTAPAAVTPALPASPLGENLLPPSATDAPATPPRADAGTAPAADATAAPAADAQTPAAPATEPAGTAAPAGTTAPASN